MIKVPCRETSSRGDKEDVNTKNKTTALLIAAVMTLALAVVVPMVMAEPPTEEVPIRGVIGSGSGAFPPEIKATWELPDDDPAVPGCQIMPNPGVWDPATGAETEGVHPIQIWVVVTDPEGIPDIMAVQNEVIDSEGFMKWQAECIEVTDPAVIEAAKNAAVVSDQITQAMAEDIDREISTEEAKIYCYEGEITSHQPAGTYTVTAYATDYSGQTGVKVSNTFEVYSILAYAIDFDVVNFGPMKPLVKDTVSGNNIMEPMNPAAPGTNKNPPTIKNLGNDPLSLKLYFDPMVGDTQKKIINVFDASFMGKTIDPIPASTWVDFLPQKLDRCHMTQIDFSVHPGTLVTSDTYTGTVHLTVIDP